MLSVFFALPDPTLVWIIVVSLSSLFVGRCADAVFLSLSLSLSLSGAGETQTPLGVWVPLVSLRPGHDLSLGSVHRAPQLHLGHAPAPVPSLSFAGMVVVGLGLLWSLSVWGLFSGFGSRCLVLHAHAMN